MTITISCDDVHPQAGWRILGDKTEQWFRTLNEEFGCKFSLFVPACYHYQYPLSGYTRWVEELRSIDWLELAAHGYGHTTSMPSKFGECEFFEIDSPSAARTVLNGIAAEWSDCDIAVKDLGWRNPGWLCTEVSKKEIENTFKYAAIHYEHNRGLQWNIPTLFGHDGIQQENINIHNVSDKHPDGMIMYTSHIAGSWNHNVWNQTNYEQLRLSLSHLVEQYQCEFKTLSECIN